MIREIIISVLLVLIVAELAYHSWHISKLRNAVNELQKVTLIASVYSAIALEHKGITVTEMEVTEE